MQTLILLTPKTSKSMLAVIIEHSGKPALNCEFAPTQRKGIQQQTEEQLRNHFPSPTVYFSPSKMSCLCTFVLTFIAGIKELPELPFPQFLWHFKLRVKHHFCQGLQLAREKTLQVLSDNELGRKIKNHLNFVKLQLGLSVFIQGN